MGFREVNAEELQFNPFTKIGKEWLLVTALSRRAMKRSTIR